MTEDPKAVVTDGGASGERGGSPDTGTPTAPEPAGGTGSDRSQRGEGEAGNGRSGSDRQGGNEADGNSGDPGAPSTTGPQDRGNPGAIASDGGEPRSDMRSDRGGEHGGRIEEGLDTYRSFRRRYFTDNPDAKLRDANAAWRRYKTNSPDRSPGNGAGDGREAPPWVLEEPVSGDAQGLGEEPQAPSWRDVNRLSQEDEISKPIGPLQLSPVAWMFYAFFGVCAAFLGDHWKIDSKDANNLGRAWLSWIKSLGPKRGAALAKFTRDVAPTLTLLGVFGSIIGPRINQNIEKAKRERPTPIRAREPQPPPEQPNIRPGAPGGFRPRNGADFLDMGFAS